MGFVDHRNHYNSVASFRWMAGIFAHNAQTFAPLALA
jgi:hypothetical protein